MGVIQKWVRSSISHIRLCYTFGLWQAPSRGIVITTMPSCDGSCPDLTQAQLERTPAAVLAGFFIVCDESGFSKV
jgi:hypothetical protein